MWLPEDLEDTPFNPMCSMLGACVTNINHAQNKDAEAWLLSALKLKFKGQN